MLITWLSPSTIQIFKQHLQQRKLFRERIRSFADNAAPPAVQKYEPVASSFIKTESPSKSSAHFPAIVQKGNHKTQQQNNNNPNEDNNGGETQPATVGNVTEETTNSPRRRLKQTDSNAAANSQQQHQQQQSSAAADAVQEVVPINMAEFTSESTFPSLKIRWESMEDKKKTSATLLDNMKNDVIASMLLSTQHPNSTLHAVPSTRTLKASMAPSTASGTTAATSSTDFYASEYSNATTPLRKSRSRNTIVKPGTPGSSSSFEPSPALQGVVPTTGTTTSGTAPNLTAIGPTTTAIATAIANAIALEQAKRKKQQKADEHARKIREMYELALTRRRFATEKIRKEEQDVAAVAHNELSKYVPMSFLRSNNNNGAEGGGKKENSAGSSARTVRSAPTTATTSSSFFLTAANSNQEEEEEEEERQKQEEEEEEEVENQKQRNQDQDENDQDEDDDDDATKNKKTNNKNLSTTTASSAAIARELLDPLSAAATVLSNSGSSTLIIQKRRRKRRKGQKLSQR